MKTRNSIVRVVATGVVIGLLCASGEITSYAQSTSPELQQVVSLSQQHMNDDVITGYIRNTGKTFKLSANDIIYLNSQGVSQGVISALLQTGNAANQNPPPPGPLSTALPPADPSVPPPLDTAPPDSSAAPVMSAPPTPTMDYFQAQLRPYGNWVEMPGYGMCWQPAVDFGWRPYYNQGHWEFTDAGWCWQSDYPWGDIAFHYGRWAYASSGWVWVPGYDYAPAWVVWRHADADGCLGWAPLPPGAVFVGGAWEFNHARVGFDFDFGLGVNFFTFVGYDHFWEHDFRRFLVPHDRMALIFRHSVIESHYRFDHGHFINEGLGRERMAALTHHEVKVEAMHDIREREEHRNVLARNDDLHNFRSGARPDARRIATEHTTVPDRSHNVSGFKNDSGKAQDNSREQSSSRGGSQGGEHGEPR